MSVISKLALHGPRGTNHPEQALKEKLASVIVDQNTKRESEFVPAAIDALWNLDKVRADLIPPTAAIGGDGILSSLLSQLMSLLSGLDGGGEGGGEEGGGGIDCSLENRKNLTPEELAWCELMDETTQKVEGSNVR